MITSMADDAIQYLKQLNAAAPDKPSCSTTFPAAHAPHQLTPEWIEIQGKFDMGWNEREQIFANQKQLGVIPPNTTRSAVADGQPEYSGASWRSGTALSADEKKLFARQEVFTAYVAYTDHEIGRVIQAVDDAGQTR
jgi:arylsulfatase